MIRRAGESTTLHSIDAARFVRIANPSEGILLPRIMPNERV
jgi:hypothetical protein